MGDPVGTGLVASLARPGGNVTGLRRLAFLGNVGNPITVLEMGEVQTAARTLGVDLVTLEIRTTAASVLGIEITNTHPPRF